jgi:glycosyltransferase involved in cell wall biosynthesis
MVDELRQRHWSVAVCTLSDDFPYPNPKSLERAGDAIGLIPDGTITLVDGLAFGAMPDIVERHARRLLFVPIVHLPLAADVGLDPLIVSSLRNAERRALTTARLVLVTGRATLELLARNGLVPDNVVVVEPGVDRGAVARGSRGPRVQLLCVATLNPGKGHEVLLRALASCGPGWQLTCAGSTRRHSETAHRIEQLVHELGLSERVRVVGELDSSALEAAYDETDLFVLATLRETYGMAVAEALAHGLPVVATATGAIPELVGPDAGLIVPPGDRQALAAALSQVIGDAALRYHLQQGALRVREHLQTWDAAADKLTHALDELKAHG